MKTLGDILDASAPGSSTSDFVRDQCMLEVYNIINILYWMQKVEADIPKPLNIL